MFVLTKFQVSSIILTSFRQGRGVILPPIPPHPPPQNRPLKTPPGFGLKNGCYSRTNINNKNTCKLAYKNESLKNSVSNFSFILFIKFWTYRSYGLAV